MFFDKNKRYSLIQININDGSANKLTTFILIT